MFAVHPRRKWRASAFVLAVCASCPAPATDFEIHTPTAGGKIVIGFKSLTEKCEFISVDIAAGDTAAQKAEKIKNKLNSQCGTIFTATVNGSTLTVKNDIHPNQRIFIHVKSDDTGEKDQIRKDVDDFWPWETDGWYEPSGATTGQSRRGDGTQGYLTIGNSRHVSQVATVPGASVVELLAVAVADLHAHGVPEAELIDLGDGRGAVRLPWTDSDAFQEFGVDDLGLECRFEELPRPRRIDLRADALTVASNGDGTVSGVINLAAVVGSDAYAPEAFLNWEVHVNGLPHAVGAEVMPVGAGFSCYVQAPPGCTGSCPPLSDGCVHVEWPTDWCGCYFDFSISFTVPANPGDVLTLLVDPADAYVEDHELNNSISATVPPASDAFWDFYPSQLQIVPRGPGLADIHVEYIVIFGGAAGRPILLRITDEDGVSVAEDILLADVGGCCSSHSDCPSGFSCVRESPLCDTNKECVGRRQHSFLNVPVAASSVLAATLDPDGWHVEARPGAPFNNTLSTTGAGGVFHDFGIANLTLSPTASGAFDVRADIELESAFDPQPILLRITNNGDAIADIHIAVPEMIDTQECCDPDDPADPVLANNCGMGPPWICFCGGRECPPNPRRYCRCGNTGGGEYAFAPGLLVATLDPAGLHVELGGDTDNNVFVLSAPCPGDIDGDGTVGQADLGVLLGSFNTCAGDPAFAPAADLNQDGCIGQPDLGVLLSNWGPCS